MNPRTPRITSRELIRALKKAGFEEQRQRGSHLHLKRISDGKRVTIPVHAHRTLPIGTLKGILRDAGITVDELRGLLK